MMINGKYFKEYFWNKMLVNVGVILKLIRNPTVLIRQVWCLLEGTYIVTVQIMFRGCSVFTIHDQSYLKVHHKVFWLSYIWLNHCELFCLPHVFFLRLFIMWPPLHTKTFAHNTSDISSSLSTKGGGPELTDALISKRPFALQSVWHLASHCYSM